MKLRRNCLTVSEWVSLALVTLLTLPSAGFATLRGAAPARSLHAKASATSLVEMDSKSSVNDARPSRAYAVNAPLAPQSGILYFVDSTGDGELVGSNTVCDDGTGKCTLRAAIQAANFHVGDDAILISIPSSDPNCVAGNCTINLTRALPNVSNTVSITGPGADKLTVRRNTGGNYRIFAVTATGTVTLSGMTISNGIAPLGSFALDASGGGIRKINVGTMNVTNCVIRENSAQSAGGGIYISGSGTLNVTNSTVNNNNADVIGGGIYIEGGPTNITNSRISNNVAFANGGGIANGGRTNITNSTISHNSAGSNGGGILGGISSGSQMTITNSTISHNISFGNGGGISGGGTTTFPNSIPQIKSSIIALNSASDTGPDVQNAFTSFGFNLIGKTNGSTGFTESTDQKGSISSPLDPKFDPDGLQDNGGPTQTIALLCSSPAIDRGTAIGLTGILATDQRGAGFPRTFDDPEIPNASGGTATDVGAFERQQACSTPTPTPTPTPIPTPTPTPTPTPMTIQFSTSSFAVGEEVSKVDLTINRSGNTAGTASVRFETSDAAGAQNCNVVTGVASSRCDYETSIRTVQFAAGETSKIISVFIINDSYLEGPETFTVSLSNPSGVALAPATATVTITDNDIANGPNPVDTASFFVRLHYLDFLNREPDAAGLAFWTNEINSCDANQQCIQLKRVNVSAAFYISIEFQQTGYLVHRIYKTSFGDASGTSTFGGAHQLPVPAVRLNEFLPDTQKIGQGVIVGQPGFEQVLEANKQAFCAEFVQRLRFASAFPSSMTPTQFVDALFANAAVTPSATDRQAAIDEFGGAGTSANLAARGRALRRVAENGTLAQQEFNRAFVLMQFFGYLRRNPNDPQDSDYTGYDFWLTKLNQFNGNFVNAEMVTAFITSAEYRQRFGP